MARILGVDPGSRLTGFGIVDAIGNKNIHVAHGTLRLETTPGLDFSLRLKTLHQMLTQVILEYKPEVMAIEKVFFAKNAVSALKLGQARGVAILVGALNHLPVFEYSATQVKSTVVGFGRADKLQVSKMVRLLTGATDFETADASDGLALALCHALQSGSHLAMSKTGLQNRPNKKTSIAEAVRHHAERSKIGT